MTSITFQNLRCNDNRPPFSLEEAWRDYGAWSGIHDFSFNRLLDTASLVIVGSGSSIWHSTLQSGTFPSSLSVRYHKTVARQGIEITGGDLTLLIATDSSGYPLVLKNDSLVWSVPVATPTEADVEVVFRQQLLNDSETTIWFSLSLYMNGVWITTYQGSIDAAIATFQVGFSAFHTDSVTYTGIVAPELCDVAEFGTLDPGENALPGLQRTTEGLYLKYFVRYDGSLRVFRAKIRSSVRTFDDGDYQSQLSYDQYALITHARMMGAYTWGEAVDNAGLAQYGHRFQEVNNPMLLSEGECIVEAGNTLKRSQETALQLRMIHDHRPLLEPEDRVTTDDGDWVINDLSLQGSAGKIEQSTNLRSYVWGS